MSVTTRNGIEYVASSRFQDNVNRDTIKWDKEWLRYFSIHKDYDFYFYDMDTDNYALGYSPEQITKFGKKEMYFTLGKDGVADAGVVTDTPRRRGYCDRHLP